MVVRAGVELTVTVSTPPASVGPFWPWHHSGNGEAASSQQGCHSRRAGFSLPELDGLCPCGVRAPELRVEAPPCGLAVPHRSAVASSAHGRVAGALIVIRCRSRMMAFSSCPLLALVALLLLLLLAGGEASAGDSDPVYRSCVDSCEKTGCIDSVCFPSCSFPVNGVNSNSKSGGIVLSEEPLYLRWKKWDCTSKCRYQCMVQREAERLSHGLRPVKYHGKWPFTSIWSLQEPASVAFSVLNLLAHFQGLSAFLVLVYYKLPLRPSGDKGAFYEYAGLWTIYGLLSMNSWFWSTVFHSRDMLLTERLDYSSAIALLGCSLILAIIRAGNLRIEAARVMVSAPIIAFISTHILFLNFYNFDYGWNMKVCVVIGVAQLLIWIFWAGLTKHPARWKLWTSCVGAGLAMLLEIYDFPPVKGILDAHALWHAVTVPLTLVWWSFIKDDAKYRTSLLTSRAARKVQ